LISSHENSDNPQRSSFEDILLSSRLTDAVARINPTSPHDAQQEAMRRCIRNPVSPVIQYRKFR
jgi:type I restriction enzyme R subunit